MGGGIIKGAEKRIENIELLNDIFGDDEWNLHDSVVYSLDYNRENSTIRLVIDTWIRTENQLPEFVQFLFRDVRALKWDIDDVFTEKADCAYFEVLHGFLGQHDILKFELNSAHLEIYADSVVVEKVWEAHDYTYLFDRNLKKD